MESLTIAVIAYMISFSCLLLKLISKPPHRNNDDEIQYI